MFLESFGYVHNLIPILTRSLSFWTKTAKIVRHGRRILHKNVNILMYQSQFGGRFEMVNSKPKAWQFIVSENAGKRASIGFFPKP